MDIQFKGGAIVTYSYEGEAPVQAVTQTAQNALGSDVTVQTGSSIATEGQTLTVSMPGNETMSTETVAALTAALQESYPDNQFQQLSITNVDPTLGGEFFAKSIVAILAAAVLILIYIAVRFKNIVGLRGAVTGVVALLNDMVVIFGIFVVLRIPLNGNFIAAMLVILGYSINDTVVIYDRIRENGSMVNKKYTDFAQLVNTGINQSLTRTINTTLTTLLALGTVCVVSVIFGLDSIFTFSFPLIIGMVSGVYSSICIAGPLGLNGKARWRKAQKIKQTK